MTSLIKKRINHELFRDRTAALYLRRTQISNLNNERDWHAMHCSHSSVVLHRKGVRMKDQVTTCLLMNFRGYIFYSIYIKMGVQMFVCLHVGMWRANGNSNPCMDLNEIMHTHPHLSKEGYGTLLNPLPHPPGPRGLEL